MSDATALTKAQSIDATAKRKPKEGKEGKCEYRHDWVRLDAKQPEMLVCRKCTHVPNLKEKQEAEAIVHLREILNPGDTIYTVLRHVSRSGMSRGIDCYMMAKDGGEPTWITAYVGHAIGSPQSMKDWREQRGLRVEGCGMDMGFHVVNSLSCVIFPEYKCLGKDAEPRCPSSYHVNHRDTVQCEGILRYHVYALDDEKRVSKQGTFGTRAEAELAASLMPADRKPEVDNDTLHCWKSETVRLPDLKIPAEDADGKELTIPQGRAYTIKHEDGTEVICPTCKGHGRYPNPEGLERFDLVHKDGYGLRHKWI